MEFEKPTVTNNASVADLLQELLARSGAFCHRNAHTSEVLTYLIIAGSDAALESRIEKELGPLTLKHVKRRQREFRELLTPVNKPCKVFSPLDPPKREVVALI